MQYYKTLLHFYPNILAEMEEYINGGCSLDVMIHAYEKVLHGELRELAINTAIWLKGNTSNDNRRNSISH